MNIFGIIKYRRTRKGLSKTGKEYVNYDYIVESINPDSPSSHAFTANETMNGRLKEQGMKDGALGEIFIHSEAVAWQGKDGEIDINREYPTRFKPYPQQNAPKGQPLTQAQQGAEAPVKEESDELPF